ncbi:hypothetical protein [Undibacterium baiyunense]|uniref:Tissue inhibitor of metalloproteinase n=1 Tax=Undibacterium baiyunense TaxID=2828731 RepID=A0A941I1Z8_9BURK|nr:hypothetical protein [Undibacterium baiyunense]MBR7745777.1 hypothetical protein [Undibacterium baiyunense]
MRNPNLGKIIFVTLLIPSLSSYACSCRSDLKANVNSAERIFLAKAISARVHNEANEDLSYVEVEFGVIRKLKGEVPKSVTVKTRPPGGDCGVSITVAEKYVIFLRKGEEQIGMCGGSHQVYGFFPDEPEEIIKIVKQQSK